MTTITESPPIQLIISDKEKLASPTLPVRWIISPEVIQTLAERDAHEPHMLIVVAQGTCEVDRFAIPLTQGMAYLQLRRAGQLDIHASIVWRSEGGTLTAKQALLKKGDDGKYMHNVLEVDRNVEFDLADKSSRVASMLNREWLPDDERVHLEARVASLTSQIRELESHPLTKIQFYVTGVSTTYDASAMTRVVVPEGIFAPEPHAWLRWLGELYPWGDRLRDQCHLRARASVTVATLPIAAVFGVLAVCLGLIGKLLLLSGQMVLLVCGKWGLKRSDFDPLWRYDNYSFKELMEQTRPSFWVYGEKSSPWRSDYDADAYTPRRRMFLMINPAAFLGLFGLLATTGWLFSASSPLWRDMLVATIVVVIGGVVCELLDVAKKRSQAAKEKSASAKVSHDERSARQQHMTRQLSWLSQGGEAKIADLPAASNRTGTAVLLFADLKAKVCKPFQQ